MKFDGRRLAGVTVAIALAVSGSVLVGVTPAMAVPDMNKVVQHKTAKYTCESWMESSTGSQDSRYDARVAMKCSYIAASSQVRGVLDISMRTDIHTPFITADKVDEVQYSLWYDTPSKVRETRVEEKDREFPNGVSAMAVDVENKTQRRLELGIGLRAGTTLLGSNPPSYLEPGQFLQLTATSSGEAPSVSVLAKDAATGEAIQLQATGQRGTSQSASWLAKNFTTGTSGDGAASIMVDEFSRSGDIYADLFRAQFRLTDCAQICSVGSGDDTSRFPPK